MSSNERLFTIKTADGFELAAIFEGDIRADRVAIMCHGINSHKQEYLDLYPKLAQRLLDHGVASLRFDFRGHGQSSGTGRDFSVIGQMLDLQAAIRWVASERDGQLPVMPYVGMSFGGAPGVLLASSKRQIFSSHSLVAPVLSYSRTFFESRYRTKWAASNFSDQAFEEAARRGWFLLDGELEVSERLILEMRLLRPEVAIGAISQPILLVHGTADGLVPFEASREIASEYPHIRFLGYQDMDHGLFISGDDDGTSERSKELEHEVLGLIVDNALSV